jgi:hypothetical protein
MGPILLIVVMSSGDFDFVCDEAARIRGCSDIPLVGFWEIP